MKDQVGSADLPNRFVQCEEKEKDENANVRLAWSALSGARGTGQFADFDQRRSIPPRG
jgi:hypothetical protein